MRRGRVLAVSAASIICAMRERQESVAARLVRTSSGPPRLAAPSQGLVCGGRVNLKNEHGVTVQ